MSNGITAMQVEEAIVWNSYRATTEAIQKAEEIATESGTGELMVEVTINIVSDAFPGEYNSGRSRSRRAGHAMCIYRSKEVQP